MEWVSNGPPMHYYARSFKPGSRPRYGFFLQEVHPVWHPPLVGADESVGAYALPFVPVLERPFVAQVVRVD